MATVAVLKTNIYSHCSHGQALSHTPCKAKRMKIKNKYCSVTLEPELEKIAGLWTPLKRLEMARKFEKWARQLRISGKIMIFRSPGHSGRRGSLEFVAPRKVGHN